MRDIIHGCRLLRSGGTACNALAVSGLLASLLANMAFIALALPLLSLSQAKAINAAAESPPRE